MCFIAKIDSKNSQFHRKRKIIRVEIVWIESSVALKLLKKTSDYGGKFMRGFVLLNMALLDITKNREIETTTKRPRALLYLLTIVSKCNS